MAAHGHVTAGATPSSMHTLSRILRLPAFVPITGFVLFEADSAWSRDTIGTKPALSFSSKQAARKTLPDRIATEPDSSSTRPRSDQ